jgi:hypothetical protein
MNNRIKGLVSEWLICREASKDSLGMFDLICSEKDREDRWTSARDISQYKAHDFQSPGLILLTARIVLRIGKGPMVDTLFAVVERVSTVIR